jgi:hypothetical protein
MHKTGIKIVAQTTEGLSPGAQQARSDLAERITDRTNPSIRSDQGRRHGAEQSDQEAEGAAPATSTSRYRQIRSTTSLPLALFCKNFSAQRCSTFSATVASAASGRHRIVVSCLNCVHSSGRSGCGL